MDKPIVSLYSGNVYDIDEVDSWMYMFNHDCSDCIILKFDKDISKEGTIYIDNEPFINWKWAEVNIETQPLLVVYVKGYVNKYNSSFEIKLSGFVSADGVVMDDTCFTITTAERKMPKNYVCTENEKIAYKSACESIVLLKNDNVLPLKSNETLNFFGEGYSDYRIGSVGAAGINPRIRRNIYFAVKETSDFEINNKLAEFYSVPSNKIPSDEILKEAKALSDTAIMIITRGSCENIDNRPIKGEYYLSCDEENLISMLSENFLKLIVVLNVAYPIDVSFISKYRVDALLYTSLGGMFAQEALISVLNGKTNPSGRLPDTWPIDYFDQASAKNFIHTNDKGMALQTDDPIWSQICYEEGKFVGYRYFTSFDKKTAFPFGFGLSYAKFKKEFVSACFKSNLTFNFNVKNLGNYIGKDVVQLYVSKKNTKSEQVKYELAGFEKTDNINIGESVNVTISVQKKHLATYNEGISSYVLEKGDYHFYLGNNAENLIEIAVFKVDADEIIKKVKNRVLPNVEFEELSLNSGIESIKGNKTYLSNTATVEHTNRHLSINVPSVLTDKKIMFNDLENDDSMIYAYVSQFSNKQLCRMNVCWNFSKWEMNQKGIAGMVCEMSEFGLKEYTLTDGNSSAHTIHETTGFPCSNAVAATFDKHLAFQIGRAIGDDASNLEIDCILAPGMNLHRNILCGRHSEYFSEDPLLTGIIAGNQVKGLQSKNVSASIKHVVANNCEGLRKRSSSLIKERTLRELYLKSFEYALEVEMPDTLMTGYNAVNGQFCDECTDLLDGIFRQEFGFNGFVMSDWNSYDSSDYVSMVRAGTSLLTSGSDDNRYTDILLDGLKENKITREELIRNICYIIKIELKRKKFN